MRVGDEENVMALRPLLLSAVVGIAALGAFHTPAAKASGYISINVGTSSPHHRSPYRPSYGSSHGVRHDPRYAPRYNPGHYNPGHHNPGHHNQGRYHRAGYSFVPGHWAYGQRGRVWVPDQYVQVQPRYNPDYDPRYDSRHDHHYDRRHDTRVIYRSAPQPAPLPGGFYDQRGG